MRKFLKEYFSFTRTEFRIIVLLSVLIFLALSGRIFIPLHRFPEFKLTEADNAMIDSFVQSLEKISYEKKEWEKDKRQSVAEPVYREFNPNTVTSKELEEMGFPMFIGKNLLRYRKAGAKFKTKSDFKKLYGVNDSIYNSWAQFLVIPEEKEIDTARVTLFTPQVIDLNSADSAGLLRVNGIGPYFAGKIIEYRSRLGGYICADQLGEIWGMDSARLNSIKPQVLIDTSSISILDINTASLIELKSHPYISSRLAESIMKYKKFAGSIRNINELPENHLITNEEFRKLKPYIRAGEQK